MFLYSMVTVQIQTMNTGRRKRNIHKPQSAVLWREAVKAKQTSVKNDLTSYAELVPFKISVSYKHIKTKPILKSGLLMYLVQN